MQQSKHSEIDYNFRIANRGKRMMIGSQLRLFRKERNMTLVEAAALLGISSSALGMYERNQRTPDLNTLIKLATFYDQSVHDFSPQMPENVQPFMEDLNTTKAFQSIQEQAWIQEAKARANSCCELCNKFAPFITPEGIPYLEAYNVSAPQTATSAADVAIVCPNCHAKLHTLQLDADIQYLKSRIVL